MVPPEKELGLHHKSQQAHPAREACVAANLHEHDELENEDHDVQELHENGVHGDDGDEQEVKVSTKKKAN